MNAAAVDPSVAAPGMNWLPTEQSFCAAVAIRPLAARQAARFVADARHDARVKITERLGYRAIVGDDEQGRIAWDRALDRQSKGDGQIARVDVTVGVETRGLAPSVSSHLLELVRSDHTARPQHHRF